MDAFSKLPADVMAKYNIRGHTFQDFVELELAEDGSYEKIGEDIEIALDGVLSRSNDLTTHPFLTESQVEVIRTYASGFESHILTEPTKDKAFATLISADGLLRCMAAACDESIDPTETGKILKAARQEILEAEKEADAHTPTM